MTDIESKPIEFAGVTVTITTSAGSDKAPVVFVDTLEALDGPNGPRIRIRLNDESVYEGEGYIPVDEGEVFDASSIEADPMSYQRRESDAR